MRAVDKLIVALDCDAPKAGEIFCQLKRELGITWFKVGPQMLLQHSGMILIENMLKDGCNLFLDLKVYDTRDTVDKTVREAFKLGARFVTVHGTPSVMEAAMQAKSYCSQSSLSVAVLAVGSLSDAPREDYNRWLEDAEIEFCDGVICPAAYLPRWKSYLNAHKKLTVCPSIRPLSGSWDDWLANCDNHVDPTQPAHAVKFGADYLVVGRPIITAKSPIQAASNILSEMEEALVA
jgi:orotidine-5'-phosphate decarboxylase